MKGLSILGASGHGRVAASIALLLGYKDIDFYDDAYEKIDRFDPWKVHGDFNEMKNKLRKNQHDAFVAIGNNEIRMKKIEELSDDFRIVSLIHPNACVWQDVEIGEGSIVMANAVINIDSKVGRGCIINTSSTVDHECTLLDGVHLSPGGNLAGGVHVGQNSWIGIGASVKECVHISDGVIVGAGACVIRDIQSNQKVVGVPAKVIKDLK